MTDQNVVREAACHGGCPFEIFRIFLPSAGAKNQKNINAYFGASERQAFGPSSQIKPQRVQPPADRPRTVRTRIVTTRFVMAALYPVAPPRASFDDAQGGRPRRRLD
jgi:hypothetical protein